MSVIESEEGKRRELTTDEERRRCRELGCNFLNWVRECPLHGFDEIVSADEIEE